MSSHAFTVFEVKNGSFLVTVPNVNCSLLIEGDDGFPEDEIELHFFKNKPEWVKTKLFDININITPTLNNIFTIAKKIQKYITQHVFDSAGSGTKTIV